MDTNVNENSAQSKIADAADLRPALRKVGAGPHRSANLSLEEAREAGRQILAGTASHSQMGAFLIALRVKGETSEELAGFALAVRDNSAPIEGLRSPTIDTAGAYDGRVRTIPVGVAAAMICRSAGVGSLFHGIKGLGRSGMTPDDLFCHFGLDSEGAASEIRYVDQNEYCPSLSTLKELRNELGLRTAFNTAEKLVGLGGPERLPLLAGVFHGGYLELVSGAAVLAGFRRALIIQGLEGSDDLPVTRDSRVHEIRDGEVREWAVELESIGIHRCPASALECKNLEEAMPRLRAALAGEPGPVGEALVLSAAARLYLADKAETLAEGVRLARGLIAERAGAP